MLLFIESLTLCQKRQKEAIKRSSNGPNIWNFVPRCRQDGGFHEVQCHVGTGQCWCVDKNGNERFGTVARGLPNCSGMQETEKGKKMTRRCHYLET